MTSQLKQTRTSKQLMLKAMAADIMDLLAFKKGRLDRVDFRILKDISNKLHASKDKANDEPIDNNKIVSSQRRGKMP